jgi:ribosomal-protein-alanine N-acetyltransferase
VTAGEFAPKSRQASPRQVSPRPGPAVALRPMTSGDLPAVLDLERGLFGAEAWSREMLESELAEVPATRHYLVAVAPPGPTGAADRVVGYAGLLTAGAQADVLTLAVAAGWQRRGTGTALLESLLAEACRRSCREVFLEVRTDNEAAQRLYRRHGFAVIGIRRGYYQPSGADALVMRLDLARGAGS